MILHCKNINIKQNSNMHVFKIRSLLATLASETSSSVILRVHIKGS